MDMYIGFILEALPTDWTGKVWITGREFDKDEKIKCRVAGEEKEMTALEVYEYLYS